MRKITTLLFLFLFVLIGNMFSQQTSIDSTIKSLNNDLNDTSKVKKLNSIARYYIYRNPDKSEEYIIEAIILAEEVKDQKAKSMSLDLYGIYYQNKGNYDQAKEKYQESLEIRQNIKNNNLIAVSYNNFGVLNRKKGEFDKSKDYFFKSLEISQQLKDSSLISRVFNNLGLVFENSGQYEEAISYHMKSLEIREKIGSQNDIASSLNNIGIIFISLKKYEEAIKYLNESLKIKEELDNKNAIASTYVNLGVVYYYKEMYDKAIDNFEKSKYIYKLIGDKRNLAATISNMAYMAKENGDLNLSIEYSLESIKILEEIGSTKKLCNSYNAASNSLFELNNYKLSKEYALKAKQLAEENNILPPLLETFNLLFKIHNSMSDYSQAIGYLEKYIEVKDSLFNEKSNKQILELQTKYETAEKEKELAQLSEKAILQKLKIEKRNKLIIALITSFILISVITFLIFRFSQIKQKQQELILEQRLLRAQMNPHFIFNAVSAIQNYIIKNKAIEASSYLSSFAKLMRSILQNSREELVLLDNEIQTLEDYLNLQKLRLDGKLEYKIQGKEEFDHEALAIPPMLLQPFIENAIEHGIMKKEEQKGKININFKKEENKLIVEIVDNGIGRKYTQTNKNSNHQSFATQITNERIKSIKKSYRKGISFYTIDLKSIENEPVGTKVIFELPLLYT